MALLAETVIAGILVPILVALAFVGAMALTYGTCL